MSSLSPTPRTRISRLAERAAGDRDELLTLLREGLVAHVGAVADDHPVVLPVAYAVDPEGPDPGGTLYLHGSVAAGWLRGAPGATVCVTVTALDGLVLARCGFNHSMNYRSAVVIGVARLVEDPGERARSLDLLVDHVVPGRAASLRPHSRKELAATAVLAVPLHEASVKRRTGGPRDDQADIDAGVWAGELPLRITAAPVVPDLEATGAVPEHVQRRADELARR